MSYPAVASSSKKACSSRESIHLPHPITRLSKGQLNRENRPAFSSSDDCGGNQSDSSTSNSSLASSPRYNERHPRVLESVRKRSSGRLSSTSSERGCPSTSGGGPSSSSQRGSFAKLGSRTSLPPLDENCTLDATESQLSLNLRRATRSTSWTNQKILDAIDGLKTCVHEIDPCLALVGGKIPHSLEEEEEPNKNESPRHSSFEKFVVPRSISNLIMKSRSSGSVNPTQVPGQNRDNSCYNFLSGIREVDDEEQLQLDEIPTGMSLLGSSGKCISPALVGGPSQGIKLKITPALNSNANQELSRVPSEDDGLKK